MYKIIWAKTAETDYIATIKYWIEHNQSATYSKKIIAEVEQKENLLKSDPFIGMKSGFEKSFKIKILKHFSLYYIISNDIIEIVAFWDNRRNPDNLKMN